MPRWRVNVCGETAEKGYCSECVEECDNLSRIRGSRVGTSAQAFVEGYQASYV